MPCVSVGTPRKPNYLPMELTHVAKGQRKAKITERQKIEMLNVATMKPDRHLGAVKRALPSQAN